MRIAIVTLPLHTNYGGILQAYALRRVLIDQGHECDLIDRECKLVMPPSWKMPLIYMKRIVMNVFKAGNGPVVFREKRIMKELPVVGAEVLRFTDKYISPRVVRGYRDIRMGEYDAFVAGSDQIWHPDLCRQSGADKGGTGGYCRSFFCGRARGGHVHGG